MFVVRGSNRYNQKSLTSKISLWLTALFVFSCTPVVHAAMVTYTYTGQNYSGGSSPIQHHHGGHGIVHIRFTAGSKYGVDRDCGSHVMVGI